MGTVMSHKFIIPKGLQERKKSIVLIRTAEGFEAGGVTSTHSALRYANAITVHCVLRKAYRPKSRHLIRMLMSLDPFPGAHHPESRIQNPSGQSFTTSS
ncbi:hypothetical protein KQX54_008138 [Cotesia glomerata]|uniref:Uncharacterized protein n=1 Tax=Cotesia glomerata TaxID=32391 RepID=A0AAV7J256_COTGL|nr:hypothetical protein KQX54_008138 [Cotesia glomerata]